MGNELELVLTVGTFAFAFYTIWKLSEFVSKGIASLKRPERPQREPKPPKPPRVETPKEIYNRKLKEIERMPFSAEEREVLRDELKREHIADSMR